MGIMNGVKHGADLTHPKASSGWLIGATVAVILLLIVVGVATYLYRYGKSAIGGAGNAALGSGSKVASSVFAYGDGT